MRMNEECDHFLRNYAWFELPFPCYKRSHHYIEIVVIVLDYVLLTRNENIDRSLFAGCSLFLTDFT